MKCTHSLVRDPAWTTAPFLFLITFPVLYDATEKRGAVPGVTAIFVPAGMESLVDKERYDVR